MKWRFSHVMSHLKSIRKLAKECSLFTGSNGCTLCPNERDECVYYWQSDKLYYRCKYFETHVLPSNPFLERQYFNEITGEQIVDKNISHCDMCGNSFKRNSNRQQYCSSCKGEAEREAKKKRDAKYRENKRRFREN